MTEQQQCSDNPHILVVEDEALVRMRVAGRLEVALRRAERRVTQEVLSNEPPAVTALRAAWVPKLRRPECEE